MSHISSVPETDQWSKDKLSFTVNLPRLDNNGVSLEREVAQVKQEILGITGGYTFTPGSEGVWLDNNTNQVYVDAIDTLTTTFDADNEFIQLALRGNVRGWCNLLRQESLYCMIIPVVDVSQASSEALAKYDAVTM